MTLKCLPKHDDTWNGETDHFPARLSEGQSQVPHDITYDRLCRGEHFMVRQSRCLTL